MTRALIFDTCSYLSDITQVIASGHLGHVYITCIYAQGPRYFEKEQDGCIYVMSLHKSTQVSEIILKGANKNDDDPI